MNSRYLETKTDGKADLLRNYINGLYSSGSEFTYLPLELNSLYLSQKCWSKFSFYHSTFGLCHLCSTNTFSLHLYNYILIISLFKNVLCGQLCPQCCIIGNTRRNRLSESKFFHGRVKIYHFIHTFCKIMITISIHSLSYTITHTFVKSILLWCFP